MVLPKRKTCRDIFIKLLSSAFFLLSFTAQLAGQCVPPTVNATPLTQTICSGTAIAQINISVSQGASFSWSRTNTINVQGIPANGNSSTINGTLVNTQNTQQLTDFIILAVDGTCQTQVTVHVYVNPKPTVSITNAAQVICSGAAITSITATNPNGVSGTTFSWTRTNTSNLTGIASSGTGAVISGNLTNITNTQQVTSFTINAVAAGCLSNNATATISVNPVPTVSASPASQTICDQASTNIVVQNPNNISGTVFSWTRNNTANVSGPSSGIGTPIIVSLDNTKNNVQTVVFTITATANGCSSSTTASVDVNTTASPTLVVSPVPGQTVCTATAISTINITTNATTLYWSRDNTTNLTGINSSGTTLSIPGTLINNTGSPQSTVFTITATTGTCTNTAITSVLVNPRPSVQNQVSTICSGSSFNSTPADGGGNIIPAGTTYTWPAPVSNPAGAVTGGTQQSSGIATISQVLTNTTSSPATLTYTVTPTASGTGSCSGTPFSVTVTVNPKPFVNNSSLSICSGQLFNVQPASGGGNIVPSGTLFTWTTPVSNPAGAITGGSAQSSGQASISQTLTNTTSSSAILTYTVTPVSGSCIGSTSNINVSVSGSPTITGPSTVNHGSVGNSYTTETGQSNYNWTVSSGGSITSGQGTNHINVTWNNAGSQTVTVTYTISGCQVTTVKSINVIPAPIVSFNIVKSATYPSPSAPGDLVTYTITFSNTSGNTASNVILTDTLPSTGLFTYVSSDHSGTYNAGIPSVTWNLGTLAPSASSSVTVTGYWGGPGTLYSYYPASYYTSTGSSTRTITNHSSIRCDQNQGTSSLPQSASVAQFCGSTFPEGSNNNFKQGADKVVLYPVSVVNSGNIFDNFILSAPSSVTSSSGTILLLRVLDLNRNPIIQTGWIAPGSTYSFFLELNGTSVTNKPKDGDVFVIPLTSTSTVCGTVSSFQLTTTTYNGTLTGLQDILVTKTASTGSYIVGSGPVTYTIIMANIGQSDATGVVLTDNLPSNVPPPLPADINQSGTLSGNTVTWPAVNIAAGVTLPPYTVTIYPNCTSVPSVINSATASVSGDINNANNTSSVTITVINTQATPVPSADNPVVCSGNTVNLSATGATGSETYKWYTTSSGGTPFATGSPVVSPVLTANTTLYVSIYNSSTLCESNRASIPILVNPLPGSAGTINGPSNVCQSDGAATYSIPVITNATSYIWSYSGTGVTITGSGTTINLNLSPTATSGTLSVFGRSSCGDGGNSQISVSINPSPSTSAIYHQ